MRLYLKIGLFTSALVVVAILVSHFWLTLREEETRTRDADIAFINLCTTIAYLGSSQAHPDWEGITRTAFQEYNQGKRRTRYTIPAVYISVSDPSGKILAGWIDRDYLVIKDQEGKPLDSADPAVLRLISGQFEGKRDRRTRAAQTPGGERVEIGYSLRLLQGEMARVRLWTGLGAVAACLFCMVITFFFSSRITRPVEQLTEALEKVSRGEFGQEVVVRSGDEIQTLAQRFNAMANILLKYFSRPVAQEILRNQENLKLSGEVRRVTVFFSDIRGFTAMSEVMTPQAVVSLLNRSFELQATAIFKHEGVINKFIGDALMAFWNAPKAQENHELKAVQAALEIQAGIAELNESLRREGKPEIALGIGINTGEAVVGNMGSSSFFDYTIIGDSVNLAQRLEGIALGGQVLISEETYGKVKPYVRVEESQHVHVKGKRESLSVFSVKGSDL